MTAIVDHWRTTAGGFDRITAAMLVLIAAYLCIEIPFSGYLMQQVATGASQDVISITEKTGRVLTGLAVFLALLPGLLKSFREDRDDIKEAISLTVISFVVVVGAVYGALYCVGYYPATFAEDRALRAGYSAMLEQSKIRREGVGDIRPQAGNAAWNAFVSTAPVLKSQGDISKADFHALAQAAAVDRIGSAERFRKRLFREIGPQIAAKFADYRRADRELSAAYANVNTDARKAWNDYIADLQRRYPGGIPTRGWDTAKIRNTVRERLGASYEEITPDWYILDPGPFIAAYRHRAYKEIEARGGNIGLPSGLSEAAFWKSGRVQSEIKAQIGFAPTVPVWPGVGNGDFERGVYRPAINQAVSKIENPDREELENGFRMARLPALALLFSLAGAALHVFKATGYLVSLAGFQRFRHYVAAVVLIGGVALMIAHGDQITQATVYPQIRSSGIEAIAVEYAIKIQPAFHEFAAMFQKTGAWQGVEYIMDLLT